MTNVTGYDSGFFSVDFLAGSLDINDIDSFLSVLDSCRNESVVQALDARVVVGEKHLMHAVSKAFDSWRHTPISRSLDMEILLYIVGERQINKAIEKAGLGVGNQNTVLIGVGDADLIGLAEKLDMDVDNSLIDFDEEDIDFVLDVFDIPLDELEAVGKDKIDKLVLERVSLLDLKK